METKIYTNEWKINLKSCLTIWFTITLIVGSCSFFWHLFEWLFRVESIFNQLLK